MDVLDQIAEDPPSLGTSVAAPRKRRLVLRRRMKRLNLRVTSAIMIMDDLANDPNTSASWSDAHLERDFQLETVK